MNCKFVSVITHRPHPCDSMDIFYVITQLYVYWSVLECVTDKYPLNMQCWCFDKLISSRKLWMLIMGNLRNAMIWTALADAIDTHRVEQYCKQTWKCSWQFWSIIFSKISANVGKFLSYQICLLTLVYSSNYLSLTSFFMFEGSNYTCFTTKNPEQKNVGKAIIGLFAYKFACMNFTISWYLCLKK